MLDLFRKMVLKYHPDRNPNNPEALRRTQEITQLKDSFSGLVTLSLKWRDMEFYTPEWDVYMHNTRPASYTRPNPEPKPSNFHNFYQDYMRQKQAERQTTRKAPTKKTWEEYQAKFDSLNLRKFWNYGGSVNVNVKYKNHIHMATIMKTTGKSVYVKLGTITVRVSVFSILNRI